VGCWITWDVVVGNTENVLWVPDKLEGVEGGNGTPYSSKKVGREHLS
jgi:hypothetical protein